MLYSNRYYELAAFSLFAAGFLFLTLSIDATIENLDASSSQNSDNISGSERSSSSRNNTSDSSRTDAGMLQTRYTGLIRSDISPEVARALGLNETNLGLIVTEVIPGSPAEKAGLRGANSVRAIEGEIVRLGGDFIVAVDGNSTAVKDREAFLDYLESEKSFGDNLTLTFIRDGNFRKANLTITALPAYFWYINPDEGIRMKYPSDWEPNDAYLGQGEIIKFFSPEEDPDSGAATASVILRVFPSDGMTLEELALRETEDNLSNGRMLDVRPIELSGDQAYESIYVYDHGENRTLKAKSIFSINGDQIYTINYSATPSRYEDYLPMIDEMVKSFGFDRISE